MFPESNSLRSNHITKNYGCKGSFSKYQKDHAYILIGKKIKRFFLICDAIFWNKFTLLFLVLPRTERQNLQESIQVISCTNFLLDIKAGGHASTVSIYYMCSEQQHYLWETKWIHKPLYRKTKKTTGQIYDSIVTGVPAAYRAVWALSSLTKDVRWPDPQHLSLHWNVELERKQGTLIGHSWHILQA